MKNMSTVRSGPSPRAARHLSTAAGTLAVATAAWLATTESASAASECVGFAGLVHCTVGDASLSVDEAGLSVHRTSDSNKAGVAIRVPDVQSWRARVWFEPSQSDDTVLFADSLADGVVTSRARIKAVDQGLLFSAAFTGSDQDRTYRADVVLDGVVQASQGGLPSGLDPNALVLGVIHEYDVTWEEFSVMSNGACQWGFGFSGGGSFELPGGQTAVGNEIRLTEEVDPAGGYPYTTFDALVFRGTFDELGFASESVQ